MAQQSFRIFLDDQSKRKLNNLARRTSKLEFIKDLKKVVSIEAGQITKSIRRNYLSGNPLHRRTGNLASGIVSSSIISKTGLPGIKVGVLRGPALKYYLTQNYGTKGLNPDSPIDDIVPRRAEAMAIPVGPALTSSGVRKRISPTSWDNLKFIPFRNSGVAIGALYDADDLASLRGEGLTLSDIPQYYLLVLQVRMKPTLFMEKAIAARLPQSVSNITYFINNYFNNLK